MARYWFGDSDDWSVTVATDGTLKLHAATRKYYDAETDGHQYVDLLIGGTTPAGEVVSNGLPVRFKGPDGVLSMWVSANDGPRVLVESTDTAQAVLDAIATGGGVGGGTGGAVAVTDNGDGTLSLSSTSGTAIVDNGDGTLSL